MEIYYFQRCHQMENDITANKILVLPWICSCSSDKFLCFIKSESFSDAFKSEIFSSVWLISNRKALKELLRQNAD